MVVKRIDKLIDAVAYLRMSDEVQSLSPEQQRREVQEYADRHGYYIIRWYCDEAKSASRGMEGDEKRVQYQKLLIDSNKRDFEVVLCWNSSRFTRNHPDEAAEGKKILRRNGVRLVTVKEGVIDWNTFEGLIKDSIYTIFNYKYAVDLGRDSLRGRRNTFINGGYPYGTIPFGYDHLYICGTERRQVRRGTRTKNLRGWIHSLAIVEEEAEIVRRIFDLYVNQDKSLCAIATILNREGVPGPGKGADAVWDTQNVRRRLQCAAYVGISHVGDPRNKKRHAHNKIDSERQRGNWTPIIEDRDLFDQAQAKLNGNQGQAHEGKSSALQGILRCACCGKVLHKENPRQDDDPRGNKYRCNSKGKGLPVQCRRWTCYEFEVLPRILAELVAAVDEGTMRMLQARPEDPNRITNTEVLKAHLESLEERIAQAADELLDRHNSPAMKRALNQRVEKLDAEITETRQRLEAIQQVQEQGGIERFLSWWQGVRDELVWIGESGGVTVPVVTYKDGKLVPTVRHIRPKGDGKTNEIKGVVADPGKLRGLLKRLNVQVKVSWRQVTEEERAARRRGRGHGCPGRLPEWVLDEGNLEIEIPLCGSSESRNVVRHEAR